MRVVFDHQVFSLHDSGGFVRYFYELAKHLRNLDGTTIDMALGLHSSIYSFSALRCESTRVYEMRTRLGAGVPRYMANELFASAVSLARGRFDIYHSTYFRATSIMRCRRLVATHHDCTHEIYPEKFRNAELVIKSKKRLYSEADAIVCISESSRQDLFRYYSVDPKRTWVVHHGVTKLTECSAEGEGERSKEKPYLLYVGARGGYKNFLALLDAYAASGLYDSYALVAVGGGPFTDAESVRIKKWGLERKVRLLPRASEEALARMYRNAALFVYPSLYEGFGFPPLEAMSLGCPVLTSNTSSLPEVCGDAAFYFDPNVPGALETALQDSLQDSGRIAEKVAKGRIQSARYGWERTARQTLDVYRAILL